MSIRRFLYSLFLAHKNTNRNIVYEFYVVLFDDNHPLSIDFHGKQINFATHIHTSFKDFALT